MSIDLSVNVGSLALHNPLMTASGCSGYGKELAAYDDLSWLSAIVGKSISREPRLGNPYPRTCETPSGMINAIGLPNEGWESYTRNTLPLMRELVRGKPTKIVLNIVGHDLDEYTWVAERANDESDIAAVELNLSCPNVAGGLQFSTTADGCEKLVKAVRKVLKLPLIAKLSPNVTSVADIARAAEAAGADSLSLINTVLGMNVDWRKRKALVANGMGGLSGPAIKPIALRCVYEACKAVKIPVIGIGGICTADDVLDFMVCGASAVQLGTVLFVEPDAPQRIARDLKERMREAKVEKLSSLIGTLRAREGA
ncbi:MAG: dihydroorotate dehydrogenase [Planctomycetes bacterium]|nr:dihydroorotate dehydrogenase [Planctomycetota bacterium]NUQ33331.1 dihydroorotate dehydrogenase [Planctomycetaceae bacterium]